MTDGSHGSNGGGSSTDDGTGATDAIESSATFRTVFADALEGVPADRLDPSGLVPGTGPIDAAVMLVGEAPGADEVEAGAPFVGRAGSRLDGLLEDVGADRAELYVTNVVKVRPPDNRTPRVGEIDAWRPVLDAELERVAPAVVVPLGATATAALLEGDEGITAVHGERFERDGRVVVPTFHPAATFYDPGKTDEIEADLRTAFAVAD